jgi:hypothetical protein
VAAGFEIVTPRSTNVAEIVAKYDTIGKLFEALRQSYQDKEYTTGVEYDAVYGFPTFLDAFKGPLDIRFAVYVSEFKPQVTPAHAGSPIVTMDISRVMQGRFDYLDVYADGYVIGTTEINLRIHAPENPPTRIWKTGQLSKQELDRLIAQFRDNGFIQLNDSYVFPGLTNASGGFSMSDVGYTISIDFGELHKKVSAFGYLDAKDMPASLYEISAELNRITLTEVASKVIG